MMTSNKYCKVIWKNIFISALAFITCLLMSHNVRSGELVPYELPSQKRPAYPAEQQQQQQSPDRNVVDESVYKEFEKDVMGKSRDEIRKLKGSFEIKLKQASSKEEWAYYKRLLKILAEAEKKKERE